MDGFDSIIALARVLLLCCHSNLGPSLAGDDCFLQLQHSLDFLSSTMAINESF